jgi:hypothetical protein
MNKKSNNEFSHHNHDNLKKIEKQIKKKEKEILCLTCVKSQNGSCCGDGVIACNTYKKIVKKKKKETDEIVVKKKKIDMLSLILIFNPLVMSVIVVMLLDYHSTIVVGVFALYLILWLMFISQFALKLVKKLIYK